MAVVVKAIIPREFQGQTVQRILEERPLGFSKNIEREYERTVAGWKGEKPKFQVRARTRKTNVTLSVALLGEKGRQKWNWLDEGTKPHIIRPVRARMLHFKTGYVAGSKPGRIQSQAAQQANGPDVYTNVVRHPGFPARNWHKMIARQLEKPFYSWMRGIEKQAAKASGHYYGA